MTLKEAVVERVRHICAEQGITLKELSRRSGMADSTLYSMMGDQYKDISTRTVVKICGGAGISLSEFFASNEFASLS